MRDDWKTSEIIGAYLAIDDSEEAAAEISKLARTCHSEHECGFIVTGVMAARVPFERRLSLMRRLGTIGGVASVIPRVLKHWQPRSAPIVKALFEAEDTIYTLRDYAELVSDDPRPEYAPGVARALRIIAKTKPSEVRGLTAQAAKSILDATVRLDLPTLPRWVGSLLDATDLDLRVAAACAYAVHGEQREAGLQILYNELDGGKRSQVAACLMQVSCATEDERRRREDAILAQLGQPAEDHSLRVLTTCGGQKTIAALTPILDGDDVQRAVHVAWILAQSTDEQAARKALRRLALYAFFHYEVFQQSEGFFFPVAPGIDFDQTGSAPRPHWMRPPQRRKVELPDELIPPRQLDKAEQDFLLRSYRDAVAKDPGFGTFESGFRRWGCLSKLDATWIPFLALVSREDTGLRALASEAGPIAHIPSRKIAAQALARINGKPATYLGMAGERRASDDWPTKPYRNQNRLIAQFIFDHIETAEGSGWSPTEWEWQRLEHYGHIVNRLLIDDFGPALKQELLDESRRRKCFDLLKAAHVAPWTNSPL